ncbi:MAG: hypothetical protein JWM97_1413 [Phycisphaerales bacterium]|nr:hypothetical protein [Phycisphaerales bacterium]
MKIRLKNHPRPANAVLRAAAFTALAAVPAFGGTSTNTTGAVQQGQSDGGTGNPSLNNSAETISLSGAAALRAFTTSPGLTYLSPGTSITLHNGTGGAAITYYAPSTNSTQVQLASGNFASPDTGVGATGFGDAAVTQNHSALRVEWHDTGSVEGVVDVINDQIGYAGGLGGAPLYNPNSRNPSTANPIWVNRTKFTTTGSTNGVSLNGASGYNTYDPTNYNLASGRNLQGGQDRTQIGIAEQPIQIFSVSGSSNVFATPGSAGYGKGNFALGASPIISGLGYAAARQQLVDVSKTNMPTNVIDPQTGTNYAAGAWNTANIGNLNVERVAVTATLFSANPGTGLSRLNRGDAQWLQTTSRLQNGAAFNFAQRDVNAGQRNVPALNTGIDPSWAVGANDGGDSGGANAVPQHSIGSSLRFSGKGTGTEVRITVAQNRMAIGPIALTEVQSASSNAPLRTLDVDFSDQTDPLSGGSIDTSKFVHLNFDTLVSGQYLAFQNEHYITVKAPNGNYNNATPDIKGDHSGDVRAFINNVTTTVSQFPNLSASVANPADQLLAKGFMLPALMTNERTIDGGPLYSNNLTAAQVNLQQQIKAVYGSNFTADGTPAATNSTIGSGATYGALGTASPLNGPIPITAQNYLFGNFNQNGVRDFSAVKTALYAQQALQSHGVSSFTSDGGDANPTAVTIPAPADSNVNAGIAALNALHGGAGATKGDLIVLGDFNGDGKFDGKDLYTLAHGAALSDAPGGAQGGYANGTLTSDSGHSTAFADQLRNGVLRKNDALDYVDQRIAQGAPQRVDARAVYTTTDANGQNPVVHDNDPAGVHAFNKLDVNRDGKYDRTDASVVDHFLGKDFASLTDTLSATLNQDRTLGVGSPTDLSVPFNLVDAKLVDGTGTAIGRGDLNVILSDLIAKNKLVLGDANFDGKVDFSDFVTLSTHFGQADLHWSNGNFVGDPTIDFADFVALSTHFGASSLTSTQRAEVAAFASAHSSAVPEPASAGVCGLGALGLLARRRRNRN